MNRWFIGLLLCLAGLLSRPDPIRSQIGHDPTAPPDGVQVQLIDNTLVAVRSAVPLEPLALTLVEQVLTIESRGSVGAVITSERFLAISETSEGWLEFSFSLNEGYSSDLVLSENMALLRTQDRVVGFDGIFNRLVPYDLSVGEQVFEQAAGLDVLVFATEYRSVGLAAGSDWRVLDFNISEIFRNLSAGAGLATVQTSSRLLIFSAATGNWSIP
jgi:hypothetical protein